MKKTTMESFVMVPESILISAATYVADDPDNSFLRVLRTGQEFKDAGMTPVYILDKENMDVHVVAEETFGKKLN